jgi:hypothetical protein
MTNDNSESPEHLSWMWTNSFKYGNTVNSHRKNHDGHWEKNWEGVHLEL